MNNEFKKSKTGSETRYTLESMTAGATGSSSVATATGSLGSVKKREDNILAQEKKETPKPRNFVAKNAKMGGAGQHKDKKKAEKQGNVKHKNKQMDMAESQLDEIIDPTTATAKFLRYAGRKLATAFPWLAVGGAGIGLSYFGLLAPIVSSFGSATAAVSALSAEMATVSALNVGGASLYAAPTIIQTIKDLFAADENSIQAGIKRWVEKQVGDEQDIQEFLSTHAKASYEGKPGFRWRARDWPVKMSKEDSEAWLEKNDKSWLDYEKQKKVDAEKAKADAVNPAVSIEKPEVSVNNPPALKEKITVVNDPAQATGIQHTGGITHGSVYSPGKPLPQSLQQKLDPAAPSAPDRAVDAKGRTRQQWVKLVKTKFPDAKIMQSKIVDGPAFAMLQDGRKLSWNKVEQGVAEGYPKHQDLSGVSTDKLKSYLAKQAKQPVPGEGSQVKRVQAELQRRSQGVAEGKDDKIAQLKKDHDTAVHWSKNEKSPQKREAARQKAEKIKAHLEKQYKQGVAEGFNGEYDDEAGMAQSNLITTARAVMGLLKTIKDRDNLPEWGQEKIAKAEMMLVSVWDYLQSQKQMGNDPQVEAYGRYDRRDAYQRDYDHSVAGMGRRNNHRDDERHDLDPSDWYIVKDGKMFKVSVYPNQEQEAMSRGYSRTRDEAKAKAKAGEQGVAEVAPPGWEKTVKAMKKHDNIDNPFALAWSMKNKGYKSHKKESADPYFESLRAKVEELAKK
jgi:hypothetical protein